MTSRLALGAILLGGGVLWLLSSAGVVELSYQTWIGVLLVAIGLSIMLVPGHHGLLALLGILVVLVGLPALVVDDVVTGGIGEATEAPAAVTQLERYAHGIGKLTIDLTSPGLAGKNLDVEAGIGIGELLVLVPEGADVSVEAHVGIGNVDALGREESGVDVDLDEDIEGTGEERVSLDLEAGIGDIRVRHP